MTDLVPIRRALISVSDKRDLVALARGLREFGVELISTGGTARALREAGIEVTPIEQITGFPEMMGGRVKTLHPAVHGGLLGRRDNAEHVKAMQDHGIKPIDLICVNLYPFEQTVLQPDITAEAAIEQIDIGGPSMVRSAAKNFDAVTVVTSPNQYDRVMSELRRNEGAIGLDTRRELAAAAFTRTAEYDTAIAAWMGARQATGFPDVMRLNLIKQQQLRYGENPHQSAATYVDPASAASGLLAADVLHGKQLSYNNINDGAAALDLVLELKDAFPSHVGAAVIKHTNPCGAALGDDARSAFERAHLGDPLAAYGGILAMNSPIDAACAEAICDGEKFFEMIIAPGFDDDAREILQERWKNVRLLAVPTIDRAARRDVELRSITGGVLVQERDLRPVNTDGWQHVAGPTPQSSLLKSAAFTWIVVKHMKSNAIAIGGGFELLGGGVGQVDRVTSCRLAIEKAGERLVPAADAVAASDAFFPFPDGPQLLIEAGVKCIVHPGGSKRDQETIDLCEQRGVICMLTGMRHFRH